MAQFVQYAELDIYIHSISIIVYLTIIIKKDYKYRDLTRQILSIPNYLTLISCIGISKSYIRHSFNYLYIERQLFHSERDSTKMDISVA